MFNRSCASGKQTGLCLSVLFSLMVLLPSKGFAGSQNTTNAQKNNDFSWQVIAGVNAYYYQSPIKHGPDPTALENQLSLSILVDLYYKGFFIQTDHRQSDGVLGDAELGYQFIANPDWSLELIYKTYLNINLDDIIEASDVKRQDSILNGLRPREVGEGIGLRYSTFIQEDIFSIDLSYLASINSGNHLLARFYYSHFIPYRNWSFYFNSGVTYFNQDTVNYYVGIDQDEVTEQRPFYSAQNDAFEFEFDALALYPLSEKWTLNMGAKWRYYSSSVSDSPIIDSANETLLTIGAMYVF